MPGAKERMSKKKEIENRIERISKGKFKKNTLNGELLFWKLCALIASTTGVGLNIDCLIFMYFNGI